MTGISFSKIRARLGELRQLIAGRKFYAGLITLLVLTTALLLILITAPSGDGADRGDEERETGGEVQTLLPPEEALLPNERERLLELEERRYRQPLTPWEPELVERFWNPVRETAVEALQNEAAGEVEEIFERVE